MWWSFQRDQKFWCTASNLGDKKSIIKIICQRCGNVCVRLGPSLGDKWPKIMSGDKSSSDVTSRTGHTGHQTLTWPAYVFTPGPPAIYLRHRKHSKDQTNTSSMLLTLFFHWNKKGTFLVLLSMSVCCLSNVLPSDCGYCFPIVDDTVSPEHKCQCYWFKLRQNSVLLTSQRSVFSSGYFVLTVHSAVLTLVTSLPITINPES